MKRILYILLSVFALTACQQHAEQGLGECVLELDVVRADVPVVASRAIDADLAVTVLDANGAAYVSYPAGDVPKKLVLEPGVFTVCVYTENQDSWSMANDGRGEGCYYASQQIEMKYDHFIRLTMAVPMTNYAVRVELPELFDELFASYQLTLKSGVREVVICEGEMAYFDIADGGFTYEFNATNTDGDSHAHSPIAFSEVQSGKCYLLNYDYGFDKAPVALEVSDNTIIP